MTPLDFGPDAVDTDDAIDVTIEVIVIFLPEFRVLVEELTVEGSKPCRLGVTWFPDVHGFLRDNVVYREWWIRLSRLVRCVMHFMNLDI